MKDNRTEKGGKRSRQHRHPSGEIPIGKRIEFHCSLVPRLLLLPFHQHKENREKNISNFREKARYMFHGLFSADGTGLSLSRCMTNALVMTGRLFPLGSVT